MSLGLPARFVSGFVAGEHDARPHCWAEAYVAEIGWVGFDPTNDLMVANDHIVLAVGRDFSDVSPVDGVIVGSRKQKLSVAVDVIPVT